MLLKRPLTAAVVCQLLALLILFTVLRFFESIALSGWQLLLLQGGLAALISRPLGMARWWLLLHMLLPLALWVAFSWQLPAWLYLVAFVVTLLLFWNSAGERVPLYLSNQTTWEALSWFMRRQPEAKFIDLGSGLAGTLSYLSMRHSQGQFTGVESAPLPMWLAKWRCKGIENVTLLQSDMWKQDLSQYDIVYCFLSPEPMPKLYLKAKKEMRPGTLLISNSFIIPDMAPDGVLELSDRRKTRLYLWHM